MSKWMTGCLVLLACAVALMWWGYHKMASVASGPPPVVTIKAPANRVFASLANGDSIPMWMAKGNIVTVSRHGMLVPGDTVRVQMRHLLGAPRERFKWVVSEVTPDKLLAYDLRSDSTGQVLATRRDSLVAMGDSTKIVSNIAVAINDSLRVLQRDTSKATGALLGATSRMLLSAFRLESKLELTQLKARLEGRPLPRSLR